MCAEARRHLAQQGLAAQVEIRSMGIDAMDELQERSFGAVVSTLVLSELHRDERRFALDHAHRVLEPGGTLVVADEVVPRTTGDRALHTARRLPALAATYLVTGSTTRPIADLPAELRAAGLCIELERRSHRGAFAIVVGRRPSEPSTQEDRCGTR